MKPTDEHEPGRGAAALLAVLMHVLFFILLVFGISWQSRHPQVTAVDLWSDLPPAPQPVEPPKPAPEVKAPPAPMPEARPEPKPEPKPEAKPEPVKPDILLKEKAEKEKADREKADREKAEKEKAEKEKRKREELQRLAEVKRKVEAEQQRQVKEQLAKEEEERQTKQDREAALKTFQTEQAMQAAAQNRLIQETIDKIQAKIRPYVVPPDIQGNPEAVYKVVLLPGGYVLSATLVKSSGVPAYDGSIERAISKAEPLPVPSDPVLSQKFRELELRFRPND
ncbi:MAG TPA: cell envelope integrity protein TolA [Burkholderiales bacterium]|nr:cell envelope integrity protein TolA [Burkholderiales bacterium]